MNSSAVALQNIKVELMFVLFWNVAAVNDPEENLVVAKWSTISSMLADVTKWGTNVLEEAAVFLASNSLP